MEKENLEKLFELITANQEYTIKRLEKLEKVLYNLNSKMTNVQENSSQIIEDLVSAQTTMEEVLYSISENSYQPTEEIDSVFSGYSEELKHNFNKSELN